MIIVDDTRPTAQVADLIIHEVNHARNDPAAPGPQGNYEDEFRAYWCAEARTTPLHLRAAAIRAQILAHYPAIANAYNTNLAFRTFVDNYNAPAGGQNMDNH